jgi:outer membrane murein-binding lipoprotein Lpp
MVAGSLPYGRSMIRPRASLLLVAAVLLSGCTGTPSSAGDFEGEEKAVAEQVEKLQSAGETGDAKVICDEVLAEALREQIQAAGSTCEQELEKAITDADDFDLEVDDVTIDGDRATATVTGKSDGEDEQRDFTFVREANAWRATDLGA